ncbi:chaperone ATPase hsp78 [Cryomyces antarcticus]|uniref:Chaperone ATPase hsp78 n=1 Tax=Cryomyces antarcticus TaxID=329879 RepID=A0ABR0LMY2_9PEZI|nr:chaperone ATPase hsp78 [Cryomyces antarcticus]KAK5200754.1 chaperone ATPase hsp78 [Cryomyces antarcticus]
MRIMMVNLRKGISGGSGKGGGIARGAWSSICQILDKFEGYHFAQIGKRITEVVDFEESTQQHRTVVKTGVDEELDNMKRTYDGIDNLLSKVARHIAEGVPADLRSDLNVIYFPQIGFLVAMMPDEETGCAVYEGDIADPWERMFTTGNCVYYKNKEVSEMDAHFGDIYGLICGMCMTWTETIDPGSLQ